MAGEEVNHLQPAHLHADSVVQPAQVQLLLDILASEIQQRQRQRVFRQAQDQDAQPGGPRLGHGEQFALGEAGLAPGCQQRPQP